MRNIAYILLLMTLVAGCISTPVQKPVVKPIENIVDSCWFIVYETEDGKHLTWFLQNVLIQYVESGGIKFQDAQGDDIFLLSNYSYMIIKLNDWIHQDYTVFFDENGKLLESFRNRTDMDKKLEDMEKSLEEMEEDIENKLDKLKMKQGDCIAMKKVLFFPCISSRIAYNTDSK